MNQKEKVLCRECRKNKYSEGKHIQIEVKYSLKVIKGRVRLRVSLENRMNNK